MLSPILSHKIRLHANIWLVCFCIFIVLSLEKLVMFFFWSIWEVVLFIRWVPCVCWTCVAGMDMSDTVYFDRPEMYKSRVLELNASDDRGINVVRTKIKNFAAVAVGSGHQRYQSCLFQFWVTLIYLLSFLWGNHNILFIL